MKYDEKDLLAKAAKPLEIASELHSYYKGKIAITPKCRVKDMHDFDIWYTPGVASPCKDIVRNPEMVYELTNKWNTVAVVQRRHPSTWARRYRTRGGSSCYGRKSSNLQVSRRC